MNNPLWQFSLDTYRHEGVATCCLEAQDELGLDVNVLLYAAWLAQQGRRLDSSHLDVLERELAPWRQRVVAPLRALRRQWRDLVPAQDLRERLKALELEAERQQQDMIWACYQSAPPAPATTATLDANLCCVFAHACPGPESRWRPRCRQLAGLLPRHARGAGLA